MATIQVEIKKRVGKPKKPFNRLIQMQNTKKLVRIINSNKSENGNISINNTSNINNNNNMKTIHKLQEELNGYKLKCQKLEEEIIQLNFKIKEMAEKDEKLKKNKEEEEKNYEVNENYSSQKINQLKNVVSSTYNILIETIELLLNQKFKDKDNTLTARQLENISMDVYEQSVNTDEEKKSLILEQIQQILIFKINFMNKMYKLNLDKLCEKIKNWNFNANKEDINASFSSFSAFSNNKKRNSNISISNSELAFGIISPPRSPKFPGRQDSNSVISNIMDESTIKDFSTSIIHYNYNNAQQGGMGADSFFFEGENLLKYKEEIENKEQSKIKDVNLINTSFKDLSIIKSGDEPGLENISFTKNIDKYVANIGDGDIGENKNKEIFIKNENQLNISFNDI